MENKRKKRSVQNKGQERRGRYCSSYHRKYIEQSRAEERREGDIFFEVYLRSELFLHCLRPFYLGLHG